MNSDVRTAIVDVIYGIRHISATTMVGTYGKGDAKGEIVEVNGEEDAEGATKDCSGCYGDGEEDSREETKVSDGEEYASWTAEGGSYSADNIPPGFVWPMYILSDSSHRDGSIYNGTRGWQSEFCIANRNETRLEPMMLSDPKDCILDCGSCSRHPPHRMLQIFSLKLAKIHVNSGSVELYGYVAMRDLLDPLLNYIVNFSRDNPIIVEQGSLIEMTGPKRGIEFYGTGLIEFDVRIKTGGQEKDDLQLIDGVSTLDDNRIFSGGAFTKRIHGDRGAVDITASCLDSAVEARIEVVVAEVQSSFDLCLDCFTSGLREEIRLFHGAIGQARILRQSVVAAVMGTRMCLKFKVGSAVYARYFRVINHGCSSRQLKIGFASILVRVTWSTLNL